MKVETRFLPVVAVTTAVGFFSVENVFVQDCVPSILILYVFACFHKVCKTDWVFSVKLAACLRWSRALSVYACVKGK